MTTPAILAKLAVKSGNMIGVVGTPGEGKSYFARSARECGKTLIALTDPKEASFYGPEGVSVFSDFEWRPHVGSFQATALLDLFKWLDARAKDDSQYVVIDTGSEISDLARHEVLKLHATDNMKDVPFGRAYTAHDNQFKVLINECRRLVVRGKTVIVTFHGQMKELEGAGDAKKEKSMEGKLEWEFDAQLLPTIGTSYRQSVHSNFDLWLYTKPQGFGPGKKYFLTAQSDQVRPAKHSVTFKQGANISQIPNTMKELLARLEEAK